MCRVPAGDTIALKLDPTIKIDTGAGCKSSGLSIMHGRVFWLVFTLTFVTRMGAFADDVQRLIPWSSLNGKPHPDEVAMDTADWTSVSRQSLSPRIVKTLTDNWTFNYFPAEQLDLANLVPGADDASWPIVAVPHTWQTYETTRKVHPFIAWPTARDSSYWWNGWGVYRKKFVLDKSALAGRRIFAEFDGVMKYCRVWLNGHELGDHKGGNASFEFDLTAQLHAGTNVLAVAVNNRQDDGFGIPPMTAGNYDLYGGIYRDVRLVSKNAVYIPFQGSAKHEGGTFVSTPKVSAENATVRVRTWVMNDDLQPRNVTLRTRLLDPEGKELMHEDTSALIQMGEIHEFDQPQFTVVNPQLWSIEVPTLYRVESEVRVGDQLMDRYASPLGFRWFEWNYAENRGYLNGRPLHIHGTNRHQEFPWLGDAVPKWIHVRDMADIRFGQNNNFLRTAHYTQDSLVYDLADRYGVLICEEVPNIKAIKFNEGVQRQQVIEMVRRDRNHPSIVMWSMGNETTDPADSAWAHAEDDTRLIHERHSDLKKAGKFITHTDKNMDMENLLRCTVRGWTDTDVAKFQPKNGQSTGTEEWQHTQAMIEGGSQRGRIDMTNGNMWCYADHGACREYENCPLKYINPKGWVDLYRIPKFMYFLWQANYLEQPMAFVHPQFWQSRCVGQKKDIVVDSNCGSVQLFVSGRSFGTLHPNQENFWNVTFKDVPVERGELKVVGRRGSQTVTNRVPMAGPPVRLTLSSSSAVLNASRASVAVLTADAVDASGYSVPEFTHELRWEVNGPGTLITPNIYENDLKRKQQMYGVFYIVAPVSTLVRSTGEPGVITVTVKADGVADGVCKINVNPVMPDSRLITEPVLSPANRQPVAIAPPTAEPDKSRMAPVHGRAHGKAALGKSPQINQVNQDIVLPGGKDSAFYKVEVVKWFAQNNPSVMKLSVPFSELVNVLVEHLVGNNGLLVADDFNNRAQQFNDVASLNDAIKAQSLPVNYSEALVRNYARRLIRNGEAVPIKAEQRWIHLLPEKAKIETISKTVAATELFNDWYPEAVKLSAAQRDRAFESFQNINQIFGSPRFDGKTKKPVKYSSGSLLLRPTLTQLIEVPVAQ